MQAVVAAAEEWGAELETRRDAGGPGGTGGRLRLPVVAGLRRGWITGQLAVEAAGHGSRVIFRPAAEDYYLETRAVAVLAMSGAGALLAVAWPLFPGLMPGAPFGVVLAVSGWLLIVRRLRAEGPAEFLASIAGHSRGAAPAAGTGNSAASGSDI
jgi:hypothetical protein